MKHTAESTLARVFEVTAATFEQDVLARSRQVPVLVDFWASWCGPCKALGPVLERLADSYGGAFVLAKVDVDAEQALAAEFGIRSIPTVALAKDGRIVDGFAGALPESGVRQFLDRHGVIPGAAEAEDGAPTAPEDPAEQVARLRERAEAAPDDGELRLELALALVTSGELAEAEAIIDALPANVGIDKRAQRARAQIGFMRLVEHALPRPELEQAVAQNPEDLNARHLLGARLLLEGAHQEALEQFMTMLERDRGFREGLPRQALVDAFLVVDDDTVVRPYRRRMTALLF